MKKSLEDRFIEFLNTLNGVENIDKLNLTQQQKDSKKADYFAENRELIVELKSLETDTQPKVEKILEPHRSRPEFPVFFGEWEVHKILKYLPDGDEINKQINEAITSSIQTIYRSANRQIETTKSTFNLLNSQGLLIVLNEKIDILNLESIAYRVRRTANKKHPDESYQFTDINSVLVISEAHFKPTENNLMAFPIVHLLIEPIVTFQYNAFVTFLIEEWSKFNSVPLIKNIKTESIEDLELQSVSKYKKETETKITRQESWERYYKWNSYFRNYNEDWLKWMFKIIMTELAFGMTKKATQIQKDRVKFWIEVFTHFMEEIDHRAIDIRFFTKEQETWKEIDAEMRKRFPEDFND